MNPKPISRTAWRIAAFSFLLSLCGQRAEAVTCSISTVAVAGVNSIQGAVNAAGGSLAGNYCVIVASGVYAEQVTVQNIATNGYQLVIFSTGIGQAVIDPPAASTAAFVIANASVSVSGINVVPTNAMTYGVLVSSANVAISSVNVVDPGGEIATAGIAASSWTTISNSSVTVTAIFSSGILLPGSIGTTVAYSTAASRSYSVGGGYPYGAALYIVGGSSNTISHDVFSNGLTTNGFGVFLSGTNNNTVTLSSIASTSAGTYYGALAINNAPYNSVVGDYIYDPQGAAAYVGFYSTGTLLSSSTIVGASQYAAVYIECSSNTLTGDVISNPQGIAIEQDSGNYNTVSQSNLTGGTLNQTLMLNGSYNAISADFITNSLGDAFSLAGSYNTVGQSTITSTALGYFGFYAYSGSSNTLTDDYIQATTAVYTSGVNGDVFQGCSIAATGAAAFQMQSGSGLTISSSSLSAASGTAGVYLAAGAGGTIVLAGDTVSGGNYGVYSAPLAGGAILSISALTISGLTPGATGINLGGGTLVSTFSGVNFADTSVGANVNASAMSAGTSITMASASGPRQGAAYDDDPNGYVHWPVTLPSGCASGFNVAQDGSQQYTTISAALNALPKTLTGATCVVIRDTQTYAEAVTVQGFTNNGYRLTVEADPSFVNTGPTVTPPAGSTTAFQILNASVTMAGISVVPAHALFYGVYVSSAYVTISSVSVLDAGGLILTAGVALSSWTTVSYASVTTGGGNTAGVLLPGVMMANVSYSAITGNGYSLALYNAYLNTFTHDFISNPSYITVYMQNSSSNTLSQSFITSNNSESSDLYLTGGGANSITGDYFSGGDGGVFLLVTANNIVSQSTIAMNSTYGNALEIESANSNVITGDFMTNSLGQGADVGGSNNVITQSTITSNFSSFGGLYLYQADNTSVNGDYIQGSTAVWITQSDGISIGGSVLVATNTFGQALYMNNTSANLTVSTSTLIGGKYGQALVVAPGTNGVILSSDSIQGTQIGIVFYAQPATLSISSLTLSGLTAGATGIELAAGTLVATFTGVNFADTSIGTNVNAAAMSTGTYIAMTTPSGPRQGAAYDDDPSNYVHWPVVLPSGCASGFNVAQNGSQQYTTISAALNALPKTLTGATCVVIRDAQTYAEQVTVQGFANNGYTLTIEADPSFVSSAPTVSPPAASTAAFLILNTQVGLQHLNVTPTNALTYGVFVSSTYATIGSVSVNDPSGYIATAGIVASSWTTVSYSSVTVGGSRTSAFWLPGSLLTSVSYSVATTTGGGTGHDVWINGGSSNTIVGLSASDGGSSGAAVYLDDNAGNNTITQSSIWSSAHEAVDLNGSSRNVISLSTMVCVTPLWEAVHLENLSAYNTITQSYMSDLAGDGAVIDSNSNYNTISLSTLASDVVSGGNDALYIGSYNANSGAYFNTITQCFLSNPAGSAVDLDTGSALNTIELSTITSNAAGVAALYLSGTTSNTITMDYVANPAGSGAELFGSDGNTLTQSTFTGNNSGTDVALYLEGSSSNTVAQDVIGNPLGNGLFLVNDADYNAITQDAIVSGAVGYNAVDFQNVSSNTIAQSYLINSSTGGAGVFYSGANDNVLSQSTVTTADQGGGQFAFGMENSFSNSFANSFFFSQTSDAFLLYNSNFNAISQSTMITSSPPPLYSGIAAFDILSSSFNTVAQSYIVALAAGGNGNWAMTIAPPYSNYNTFSQCQIAANGAQLQAVYVNGGSSNTITQSLITNPAGTAAFVDAVDYFGNPVSYNTISLSTITSAAAPAVFTAGPYLSISGDYIQGSTAVYVFGATGTAIGGSVLVASNALGQALKVSGGSAGLSLTTSRLIGGSGAQAIYLDQGNSGTISLSSDSVAGAQTGVYVAAQSAGTALSISSLTLSGLTAGATAINLAGGTLVSTFTGVNFADASIGANVNASGMSAGTNITMANPAGPRQGPAFDDDPNSYVHWLGSAPVAPSNFAPLYATTSSILWNWNDNVSNATGYQVMLGTTSLSGNLPANTTSWAQIGLTPNDFSGSLFVQASNAYGTSSSAASSTYTLAAVPSSLSFFVVTSTIAGLSWSADGNPGGTIYEIDRSTGGSFVFIGTNTANSYIDFGLTPGATYQYEVQALNNSYIATAFDGPISTATPRMGASLTAAATAAYALNGFVASATLTAGGQPVQGRTIVFDFAGLNIPALTNSSGLAVSSFTAGASSGTYSYNATFSGDSSYLPASSTSSVGVALRPTNLVLSVSSTVVVGGVFTASATLTDTATSAPISGQSLFLIIGGSSQIVTTNGSGSAFATFTAPSSTGVYVDTASYSGSATYASSLAAAPIYVFGVPPAAPTNFTALYATTSSILWNWNDNSSNATGYQVMLGTTSLSGSLPADTTSWAQTGLTPNDFSGSLFVQASNAYGTSNSAASSTYTLAAVPSSLAFSVVASTVAGISWSADGNPAGTYYEIGRSTGGSFVFIGTTTASPYYDFGVTPGAAYQYEVEAINGSGIAAAFAGPISTTTPRFGTSLAASAAAANALNVFTASATLTSSGSPLQSAAVVFSYQGTIVSAFTSSVGLATASFSAGASSGAYAYNATFGGSSSYAAASSTAGVSVGARSSAVSSSSATAVVSSTFAVAATLLDASSGAPISGATLQFSFQSASATAVTNGAGTASALFAAPASSGTYFYIALFPGNATYSASASTNVVVVSNGPPPVAPSHFAALYATTSSILWNWNDNSSNATGYQVMLGTVSLSGSLPANTTSWAQTGLTPNDFSGSLFVQASNAYGASDSAASSTYTLAAVPSALSFSVVASTIVGLSWSADGNPAGTYYEIDRSSGGPFVLIATITSNSYLDLVTPGGSYQYEVQALNGSGIVSAFDGPISTTTPMGTTSLSLPSVSSVALGGFAVGATLTSGGQPVQGRRITFSFSGLNIAATTNSSGLAVSSFPAVSSSGTYSYNATFDGDSSYDPVSSTAVLTVVQRPTGLASAPVSAVVLSTFAAAGTLSDSITGAPVAGAAIQFLFQGVSTTVVTNSSGTASAVYTAPAATGTYFYTAIFPGSAAYAAAASTNAVTVNSGPPPAAPSNLTPLIVTASSILWAWNDNSSNAAGYQVMLGTASLSGDLPAGATTWFQGGLSPDFLSGPLTVQAFNAGGVSYSPSVSTYTLAEAPTGLSFALVASTITGLSWSADGNPGNALYLIDRSTGGSFVFIGTSTTNSYFDFTVNPGSPYQYEVQALNASGIGTAFAGPVSTTTPRIGTSLAASATTSYALNAFVASVTLTAGGQPVQGRGVTFSYLGTNLGAVTNSLGQATTSYYAPASSGAYAYAATFEGDSSYIPSSSTGSVVVGARPTSLSVAVSSYVPFGSVFAATATLTDALTSAPITGEIVSFVFASTGQAATTNAAGIAAAYLVAPSTSGVYSDTVAFAGSATYAPSLGGGSIVVGSTATGGSAPTAPSGLTAVSVTTSSILFVWVDNSTNTTGINVLAGNTQILATLSPNATAWLHTGLSPNGTSAGFNSYAVEAFNSYGSAISPNVVVNTLAAVPAAPAALATSSTTVTVTWSAANNPAGTLYVVARSTGGALVVVGTTTATSFFDSNLANSTTYEYEISALNNQSIETAYSGPAFAATSSNGGSTPPVAPSSVTAQGVSASQISVSWIAAPGAIAYLVYRGGVLVATTTAASYSDTGLAASKSYAYAVAAYNSSGDLGPQSATVSAATLPPTPVLQGYAQSTTQNYLMCFDSGSLVVDYQFYRNGSPLGALGTSDITDTGLSPDTTYTYTVAAFDSLGHLSLPSAPLVVYTFANAPAALNIAIASPTVIAAAWSANGNPAGAVYLAQVSNTPAFTTIVASAFTSTTTALLTGLTANASYYVEVQAINGNSIGTAFFSQGPVFLPLLNPQQANTLVLASTTTVTLIIPPNALTQNYSVSINTSPATQPEASPSLPSLIDSANNAILAGGSVSGIVPNSTIEVNAYNGQNQILSGGLNAAATVSIGFSQQNGIVMQSLPIRTKTLSLYYLNARDGNWVRLPGSNLDTASNVVTAQTSVLGVFAVMGVVDGDASTAYAYPVPFRPSHGDVRITFANLPQVGTIKIYTVGGKLVQTLNITDGTGLLDWDVTNSHGSAVASGVYMYLIDSGSDQKIGKLMIIR